MREIRMENLGMGKTARAALSVVLAGALAAPMTFAPNLAFADEEVLKDETVYVRTDAMGEVESIQVVNMFDTDDAEKVNDPADYTQVKNLSSDEALSQTNGEVSLTTLDGEPFYYQGTMETDTQLPWDVNVTYKLDGVEVTPENLAGKSGDLQVILSITSEVDSDEVSDFANGFVVQAQGTFPGDNFKIENAEDVTTAIVGNNTIASCMVLPGESKTFTIEGEARNFEYDGWQISAMPLALAINIKDEDTSALTEKTSEITDGANSLDEGANSLLEGLGTLSNGVSSLAEGSSTLSSGASNLSSGASSLFSGVQDFKVQIASLFEQLSGNISQLATGSSTYLSGIQNEASNYAAGASQLDALQAAYAAAAHAALVDPSAENVAAMDDAAQALAQASGAAGAYQALSGAASNYAQIDSAIQALNGSTSTIASQVMAGIDQLIDGASQVSSGAAQVNEGAASLNSGASQLNEGATSAESGAATLANGTGEFASALDGIDGKILDELQATIDEKLGDDFEEHSFVVPTNMNVESVQFVYVVDGVSVDDDEDEAITSDDESEETKTVVDRFFDLFN